MLLILVTVVCLVAVTNGLHIGHMQSTRVKGVLMCNSKPADYVKVKLYDDDRGVDSDDLMAEGRTDAYGSFVLEGHTAEFLTINPKINIYHKCNRKTVCSRKLTFWVPQSYVSKGKTPHKTYDIGTIQLALRYAGETRDCFN